MTKYQIVCKGCNTKHGYADKPVVDGLSAKCGSCGLERIAIEPLPEEIYTQMDFDLFITNKKTGISRHQGTMLSVEDLKGKTEVEIRNVLVERLAKTLVELVKHPENIQALLENQNIGGN